MEAMINVQPTVIIGLGEVGRRSVAYLKRRMYEIYGPLESVMLLTVTVRDEETEARRASLPHSLLPREEWFLDLTGAHEGADNLAAAHPWLPAGVVGSEGTDRDARAAARLALMVDADRLVTFLRENLRRIFSAPARDAMATKGLEVGLDAAVFVVAALDDPVGSGLVLDVVYLTQTLLDQQNVSSNITGVFFLPEPHALDDTRGANVYAALKELDYHMNGNQFNQEYAPTVAVDTKESKLPPFNNGCYLLDTINEKQYALGDRDQASAMLGEWLFQASLTPCKQPLVGAISAVAGQSMRAKGRLANYGSLGLAGYILPIEGFVDWCANRLGEKIIHQYVRGATTKGDVVGGVSDFENDYSLMPKSFKDNVLKAAQQAAAPAQTAAALEAAPWAVLETNIRGEARQIEQTTTAYARQAATRQAAHRDDVAQGMKSRQHDLLNQAEVKNHVPLALQFFRQLKSQLENYHRQQEQELEKADKQVVARARKANEHAGTLFRTLSSIPRSALDYALIVLAAVVGFLVPLFLVARLILAVTAGVAAYVLLVTVVVASFGVIAFIVWQMRTRIARARNDFIQSFGQYANARIERANTKELLAFYPEAIRATEERTAELTGLYTLLGHIRDDFAVAGSSSSMAALIGEVDFPLQRSLLTEEFIEAEYTRHTGDLDKKYQSFLMWMGTPATWLAKDAAQLEARMLAFGRDVFKPLRDNTVNFLLELAPDDAARRHKVQTSARELLNKSAPMWTYNRFVVGQELSSGNLTAYSLLAFDDPDRSQIDAEFQGIEAKLMTVATHDSYRMQVIKLRQGYPLFGLRAFEGLRGSYAKRLQAERPLHVEDKYLTVDDPKPLPTDVELHASIPALFAVGCVAGLVAQDGTGRYAIRLDEHTEQALATTPERSVAMLSMTPEWAATLGGQIDAWVESNGKEAAATLLKAYVKDKKPEKWEKDAIEEFVLLQQS